jgi:hypothetical protein
MEWVDNMTDARFAFRMTQAMAQAFTKAAQLPEYAGADSTKQYELAGNLFAESVSTADRIKLEAEFEQKRIPGFLEANREIFAAIGKIVEVHVDNQTQQIVDVALVPVDPG